MVANLSAKAGTNNVDAVDLLDASFHNLTTVDENNISPSNDKPTKGLDDDGHDEDFDAFASSKRLKEKEELQESISKIKSNPVTEDQKVEKEKKIAELEEDINKGLEPTLVVTDSRAPEGLPVPHDPKRFVSPKDFELLKVIGMGAFGKVLQVRNKKSNQILAMKVMSKRLLNRKMGYIENIQAERNILTRVRHPFVVMMHASFQTKHKLFIVMDFLAGGELFLRLGREGIFLEKTAAFYLAEIILALEFLHNLGVLHRDLKPENILLGEDGHVCLTDFGLAKDLGTGGFQNEEDDSRSSTICGTQEYMAPEMVARQGYGRAADYWSLGCIAYEMLNGLPPFRSKLGAKDLFRKIMSEKVKMPDGASAAACKLLKGLLHRTPQSRLGAARSTMFEIGGPAGLKKAEFFKQIEWEKLERKEVEPPERLSVQDDRDVKHFHDEFTTMPLPRSVVEESRDSYVARRIDSKNFRGFSFVQKDFVLPERDSEEVHKYWNSEDEEGESASECASSKFGGDGILAPGELEQDKKKRPPRKKKKKKVGEGAAIASVASSVDLIRSESPVPRDDQEPPREKASNEPKPPQTTPAQTVTVNASKTSTANVRTSDAAPSKTIAPVPVKPAQAKQAPTAVLAKTPLPKQDPWKSVNAGTAGGSAAQPYSLDSSRNQKYIPPQRRGTPVTAAQTASKGLQQQPQKGLGQAGWAGPQQQHFQQQPSQAKQGWTIAHQHQPMQGRRGWATAPSASPGPGRSNAPPAKTPPANTPPQVTRASTSAAPSGPVPGSWAAKIASHKPAVTPTKLQSHVAAPPPASPMHSNDNANTMVPPSPSSDWRNHAMSPSPRPGGKVMDSWPGLEDFPAPPSMGAKQKNTPKAVKPMGAWAAKR